MLLIILLGVALQGNAQNYQLHTVYLYSFTKYIQWPENSADNFRIQVLGRDSGIIPFLEKLAESKKAGGKPISVVVIDDPGTIGSCDMLFISEDWSQDAEKVDEWALKAHKEHFLLLTDNAPVSGISHVNFTEADQKLIFELNRKRTEAAGLRVSTELLALARIVDYQEHN